MRPGFNKTCILGVGLIGASLALAMRQKGICGSFSGSGRKEENLKRAKERGIIDMYSLDPADACKDADLIVLASPVGVFKELAKRIAPALKKGAIVIDVGSVKGSLVGEIEALMPEGVSFVGCHPIAGSDRSGIDSANPELFKGALVIITKSQNTDPDAFKAVSGLWGAVDSEVRVMDPALHDRIYATVSHSPHLIAYALVNAVADIDASYLDYAGQGFKDATRIASSSPEMWRDIAMANRENVLEFLKVFKANVEKLSELLDKGDSAALEKEFERAKKLRDSLKSKNA